MHPSDWHRYVTEGEFQKRTRCDNMQFRHLFEKISQRHDCPGTRLNFIEKEQGLSRYYPAQADLKTLKQIFGIEVAVKKEVQIPSFFQVDRDRIGKIPGKALFNQPGLAYLAGAKDN